MAMHARPLPLATKLDRGTDTAATMAEEEEVAVPARGVKDVPAEDFITAYAAHLKTNDKVQEVPRPAPDAVRLAPGYLQAPVPRMTVAMADRGREGAAASRACVECLYADAPCFHSLCRRRRNAAALPRAACRPPLPPVVQSHAKPRHVTLEAWLTPARTAL